jgi:hypothetical protein
MIHLTRPMIGAVAVTAALVLYCVSRATPPPPGSEAAKIMSEEGPLIRDMKRPGTDANCCDESDCRPAEARITARGTYQVFVRSRDANGFGWDGGPNQWLDVPYFVVIPPAQRRVQQTVACWTKKFYALELGETKKLLGDPHNGFLCFNPGQGM